MSDFFYAMLTVFVLTVAFHWLFHWFYRSILLFPDRRDSQTGEDE